MYGKVILSIILIILIFLFQISFINGLPFYLFNFNFVVVLLILILGIINFKTSLYWTLGFGILFEVYSFLPTGAYLLSLIITIFLTNFLLNNFFTNRSLYSFLALTTLATIIYEFLIVSIGNIFSYIFYKDFIIKITNNFWENEISKLIINIIGVFFLYYVSSLISKKLRPVFLIRNR